MAHIWCALAPLAYCPRRTGAMCHPTSSSIIHSFVVKGRFATERTLTSKAAERNQYIIVDSSNKAGCSSAADIGCCRSSTGRKLNSSIDNNNNKARQARHTHTRTHDAVRLHRLFSYSCNNALRNIAEGEPKRVLLSFYIPSFYHQHHVNNNKNNARRCRGTPVPAAATSSPPASDNTCCSRQSRSVWCHHGTLQDRSSSLSMEE